MDQKRFVLSLIFLISLCLSSIGTILADTTSNISSEGDNTSRTSQQQVSEIDVLHSYGADKNTSSATIVTAIKSIKLPDRAVLVLKPAVWHVTADFVVPMNVSLKMQQGAVLSIDYGKKVVFDGSIVAGVYQIFSGVGQVLFRQTGQDVYPNWWKSKDDKSYAYAIQKALSSGAKAICFTEGIYEVSIKREYSRKSINVPSNIRIHGRGDRSIIKLIDTPATTGVWAGNDFFTGNEVENIEISGITFDAEKFYPDPETISRQDPSIRGTRAIHLIHTNNCRITDCRFRGFTNGSILVTGNNIVIDRNYFHHGSYRTQTIRLDGSKTVTVTHNTFEDNGPHHYMALGRAEETSSTDAIMVGNEVNGAYIANNRITDCSGVGIRVENSRNVHVIGNIIDNTGREGITFYRKTSDCSCIGNIISNWGKIPDFGYIRKQHGKIYNPIEYHCPPPLASRKVLEGTTQPLTLEGSSTWEINRYDLGGRDNSSIPGYDPTDYKIFSFRGFSGISVTEMSHNIFISANELKGNESKTQGLFNYASNFGINIGAHSENHPVPMNGNCIIIGNSISGCIDYDLYCPQYVDPAAMNGVAEASVVFGNVCNPAKVKFFYRK
jgi:parallel beta-helix repeat protein